MDQNGVLMTVSFSDRVYSTVSELLEHANRVPYLFIGSGVSQRYMKTENWKDLLSWVCQSVGKPMRYFYYYAQKAQNRIQDKLDLYPEIAQLMEDDFLDAVDSGPLQQWGQLHATALASGTPAMKIYIAEHLAQKKVINNIQELAILRASANRVAGVITTNYDKLIESIFPNYDCYIYQKTLLFSSLTGIGEIYKIHGSVTDPNSMILDKRDYREFGRTRDYLVAKLLTILGEYPVIYLGYSLSDPDVQALIRTLAVCAGQAKAQEIAERFVFVEYSESEHSIDRSKSFDVGDSMISMCNIQTDDFTPIYKAIRAMNQRYAPAVIRQLTRQIFDESLSNIGDNGKKVIFQDFNGLSKLPQNAQIVIGIGRPGYGKPVRTDEIYEDVLFDNKTFDAELIVEDYLDVALSRNAGGLPMYKYLKEYPVPVTAKIHIQEELKKRTSVDSYLSSTELRNRNRIRARERIHSLADLIRIYGEDRAFRYIYVLHQEEIDCNELGKYLRTLLRKANQASTNTDKKKPMIKISAFRKCIRIYDFLMYYRSYINASTVNSTSTTL